MGDVQIYVPGGGSSSSQIDDIQAKGLHIETKRPHFALTSSDASGSLWPSPYLCREAQAPRTPGLRSGDVSTVALWNEGSRGQTLPPGRGGSPGHLW
jgi:hypothetical protein